MRKFWKRWYSAGELLKLDSPDLEVRLVSVHHGEGAWNSLLNNEINEYLILGLKPLH